MAICGIYVHLADAHELIQTNWCIWSEEGQRQKRQQGHGRSCHLLRKGANINAIHKELARSVVCSWSGGHYSIRNAAGYRIWSTKESHNFNNLFIGLAVGQVWPLERRKTVSRDLGCPLFTRWGLFSGLKSLYCMVCNVWYKMIGDFITSVSTHAFTAPWPVSPPSPHLYGRASHSKSTGHFTRRSWRLLLLLIRPVMQISWITEDITSDEPNQLMCSLF